MALDRIINRPDPIQALIQGGAQLGLGAIQGRNQAALQQQQQQQGQQQQQFELQKALIGQLGNFDIGAGAPGAMNMPGLPGLPGIPERAQGIDLGAQLPGMFPSGTMATPKKKEAASGVMSDADRRAVAKATGIDEKDLIGVSRETAKMFAPTVFFNPATQETVKGPPGAKMIPPQPGDKPMSGESAKVSNLARSGVESIDKILESVKDPKNKGLWSPKNLAGGIGAEFFSTIGGTDAQIFNDKITEAQDALARLRTGAAITAQEEERYNKLLRGRFKTIEAYTESLSTVRKFLEGVDSDINNGKRSFGGKAVAKAGGANLDAAIDKVLGN